MFGFGEKKEKEREQRKVKWVAPTTGNVYYEGDYMPYIEVGGDIVSHFNNPIGSNDDWVDYFAPEHEKRNRKAAENIEEMKKMIVDLVERQKELENMVASLIRRQYDREQRKSKAEVEEETEYQR